MTNLNDILSSPMMGNLMGMMQNPDFNSMFNKFANDWNQSHNGQNPADAVQELLNTNPKFKQMYPMLSAIANRAMGNNGGFPPNQGYNQ